VGLEQAQAIVAEVPPLVGTVGLFVNAGRAEVLAVLAAVRIDILQFHGDEPPADCEGFGKPYIKAVRMREDIDLHEQTARYRNAGALLLDAWDETRYGGTGQAFDWSRIPLNMGKPVILAGGLSPANVAEAVQKVRPYAVDVSGGIESAKGIKDPGKMRAFLSEVYRGID
jgi:phosphoribosylanthranilate isomerase